MNRRGVRHTNPTRERGKPPRSRVGLVWLCVRQLLRRVFKPFVAFALQFQRQFFAA